LIYFDTTYIGRLYFQDSGWDKVRELAKTDKIACAAHGRAEALGIFHRKLREQAITADQLKPLIKEFQNDCEQGAFNWLPLSASIFDRVAAVYLNLPATMPLRAADALHLACAAEHGFKHICSNDARLLKAASYFDLSAVNVF
jgi:predicted nucleic acid-binding protein